MWPRIDFARCKYGRELLVDAGWIHEYPTFILRDEPHQLSFHEILLITAGRGRVWIESAEHHVYPGTVLFTAPGQVRRWRATGVDGVCVYFRREFFSEWFQDPLFVERLGLFGGAGMLGRRLPPREATWLRRRLDDMLGELRHLRSDSSDLLRAVLYEILVRLNRLVGGDRAHLPSVRLVLRFRALLEQHLHHTHRVTDYARRLGVTPGHLNDLSQRHLGQSAGGVIRARVVAEARRRLLHSSETIAAVAEALGFADPAYFSRFFRRETGVSPASFRDSIREKDQSHRS